MEETKYIQPKSLEELAGVLREMTVESRILAGGTDLLPMIRSRHPRIDQMISLCKIEKMQGITKRGDQIRIGAMVTHTELAENPLIQKYCRALSMACGSVGSKQIRNKGTIAGSLANANPAGDLMPCVCLLGGQIEVYKADGTTYQIDGKDFIQGVGKHALKAQEVILAIWIPVHEGRDSCFVKLGSRTEVTIAQISLALSWNKESGKRTEIESYLGAVDTKPIYLGEIAAILGQGEWNDPKKDAFAAALSDRIRAIREARTRQPKLRILESEKLYKERAVKSVVYDAIALMEGDK